MFRRFSNSFRCKLLTLIHPELTTALFIPSHLTPQERITLKRLATPRRDVLEIGSYLGASACCFAAAHRIAGSGRVYCVDTWDNDAMSEGIRDTYEEFMANTAPFAEFIVPIRGFSTDVVAQVLRLTDHLDLLFIDGDHSYRGVKSDWDTYSSFLGPDSLVVFHDSGWAEGVKRVIAEEVAPLVSTSDRLPNMWWGTLRAPPC